MLLTHSNMLSIKVDCVAHEDFCLRQQQVLGYPTLRLFHNGEKYGDYNADRSESYYHFLHVTNPSTFFTTLIFFPIFISFVHDFTYLST